MIWLDDYERRARLVPGLLALLPIAITSIALGLDKAPVASSIISLLSVTGAPVLLAGIVRSRGSAIETSLFNAWEGPPTTHLLRLREAPENKVEQQQWRNGLAQLAGVDLPDAEAETKDPEGADEVYGALATAAREATRDRKKYALLFEENRNYGFQRNLLGTRPIGIALSLLGAAVSAGVGVIADDDVSRAAFIAFGLNAAVLLAWIFAPSEKRVRQTGEHYARQLLISATVGSTAT